MRRVPVQLAAAGLVATLVACGGAVTPAVASSGPQAPSVASETCAPSSGTSATGGEFSPECFGVRLLGAVSGDGRGNALVSPLGVRVVLTMAAQGARAPVRHAIGEMLAGGEARTGDRDTDPLQAYRLAALLTAADEDDGVTLRAANGVFADLRLDVYPAFSAVLEDRFGAPTQRLDFADADAVERINAWAAQATGGVIPRLLSALEPDDVLVLANAVHFKGEWSQPFDPARTAPLPFHPASGEAVEVPTMQADDLPARYRDGDDFQALRLPYGEGAFALTVVLPRAGLEPAESLERLAADPSWLGGAGFRRARGSLTLPRLTLESEASLLPVLRGLGLEAALEDELAFAGIAAPAPLLSRVVQATRLVLDEEGTEAAAATAAVMTTRSAVLDEDGFEMRVDRPFALAVRHRGTGALLFAAWVAHPGSKE